MDSRILFTCHTVTPSGMLHILVVTRGDCSDFLIETDVTKAFYRILMRDWKVTYIRNILETLTSRSHIGDMSPWRIRCPRSRADHNSAQACILLFSVTSNNSHSLKGRSGEERRNIIPWLPKKHANDAPAGPAPTIKKSVSTIPF